MKRLPLSLTGAGLALLVTVAVVAAVEPTPAPAATAIPAPTTAPANVAVGRSVELDDIAKLDGARAGLTASDVKQVYTNLRRGSMQHLAAFDDLLGR
jgi:Uncharacterized protein conserved in archaea